MAATIKIKNSSTAGAAPTASDLVQGELAVNVTDKRLYTENSGGTIVELGTNPSVPVTFPDGSASAPSLTNSGDTNTGMFFPAADTIAFAEGGTETMRLDSSGNMGLGVTPSAWSGFKALQIGTGGALSNPTSLTRIDLSANWYYNGTNDIYIGTGAASLYRQNGGQHIWFQAGSGTAGGTIGFTQAMTLDASGNFMVGTTTPLTSGSGRGNITINGTSSAVLNLGINGSRAVYLYNDGTNAVLSNDFNGYFAFQTNATERARIDSSGNLLVGTTTALDGSKLSVYGPNGGHTAEFVNPSSTGYVGLIIKRPNSTGSAMVFSQGASDVGSISVTGSATAYNTSSDHRLKHDIQPMSGALAKVSALKPCTYKWNVDNSEGEGFIAHELAEVVPHAVYGEKDAVDENGNPKYQGIDTSFLVATLTAAIQELNAKFEAYKAAHP